MDRSEKIVPFQLVLSLADNRLMERVKTRRERLLSFFTGNGLQRGIRTFMTGTRRDRHETHRLGQWLWIPSN